MMAWEEGETRMDAGMLTWRSQREDMQNEETGSVTDCEVWRD